MADAQSQQNGPQALPMVPSTRHETETLLQEKIHPDDIWPLPGHATCFP